MRTDWGVELEHRVIGAPETVFEYFVDPAKYRRWKGLDAELDPRPGGVYRVAFASGVWVTGEYVSVEPPDRLVVTWGWESEAELPPGMNDVPAGSSRVEFRFVPDGDGTVIKVRHTALPSPEAQSIHTQGWSAYLPRLEALTRGSDPGEDPSVALTQEYLGAPNTQADPQDAHGRT